MNKKGDDVDIDVVTSLLPSLPLPSIAPTHSSESYITGLSPIEPLDTFPAQDKTLRQESNVNFENTENETEFSETNEYGINISLTEHTQHITYRACSDEIVCFVDSIIANALQSLKVERNRLLPCSEEESNMGNKQTSVKSAAIDEDTPDEAKCCQVPKKKIKDKSKRTSRGSRSDDLAFDSHEVYPFERGSLTEQELSEPVELEPFEIVDTDDIRFVPGAGSSDVIKSISEPKFTTIPEEVILEENEDNLQASASTSVGGNRQFYIEKGNRLMEPGTSTAHSTFEFKQVKSKTGKKVPVPPADEETEPLYENIADTPNIDHNKPSTSSEGALPKSPSSSVGSSRDVSRKNSKEAVQKPLRKSKKGKQPSEEITTSKESNEPPIPDKTRPDDEQNKPRAKKGGRPAIRDSEIDRNIDSVFMLTQTMFSKLKKPDEELTKPPDLDKCIDPSMLNPEGKYENVNVCVKLEPTGLAIAHKETKQLNEGNGARKKGKGKQEIPSNIGHELTQPEQMNYENVGVVAKIEPKGITLGHKGDPPPKCVSLVEKKKDKKAAKVSKDSKKKRKASDDKEFVQISRQNSSTEAQHNQGILHISDSGTLIIKADKTESKVAKQCESGCISNNMPATKGLNQEEVPEQLVQKAGAQKRGMLQISDTGTLIIHSLPQPPGHAPSSERGSSHYYENEIIDRDTTDIKVPYEEIADVLKQDTHSAHLSAEEEKKLLAKRIDETKVKDEDVPPPSPSAMLILEEEEEEEDEEEVFEDAEEKRKSAEIIEFTESVCKRLSQYLESQASDNEDMEAENEDYLFESGAFENDDNEAAGENYYETLTDKKWKKYDDNCSAPLSLQGSDRYDNVRAEVATKDSLQSTSLSLDTSESTSTLKRNSGESEAFTTVTESLATTKSSQSSEDGLPEYFDLQDRRSLKFRVASQSNDLSGDDNKLTSSLADATLDYDSLDPDERNLSKQMTLPLRSFDKELVKDTNVIGNRIDDIIDRTPTTETVANLTPLAEMATAEQSNQVQFETGSGRRSVTCTESDLDISEHRDDLSTDSMLADDEEEETMDILFSKTYTEPEDGAEVFLSCTVVNSAYKDENKKSETWLSDEALEYLEASASDVMSMAFMKAKREMKDIQVCLQSLRQQMEHFHGEDRDDISLPDIPVEHLSPDYFGLPRKAITD